MLVLLLGPLVYRTDYILNIAIVIGIQIILASANRIILLSGLWFMGAAAFYAIGAFSLFLFKVRQHGRKTVRITLIAYLISLPIVVFIVLPVLFSQFIVKATQPPLQPLRRVIPGTRGVDVASVVLMFALQFLALWLIYRLLGASPGPVGLAVYSVAELLRLLVK